MRTQPMIIDSSYSRNAPMIDSEFDLFEMNDDFSDTLHEAEAATFYHDASDLEE